MKKLTKTSIRVITSVALAVGLPGIASAQNASQDAKPEQKSPPTDEQAGEPEKGFADIIVTARRREEQLQQVPVAITAFTPSELATNNVTRMENLTTVVPGLNVSPAQHRGNVPGFAIRGQRQDAGFLTNDPSVGVYIAEAVQARNFGLAQSLYDMESVQVLKGPQGTLFGRNTTGGAILFQPTKPDLTQFSGYVQGRLGNYQRADAIGVLNVPISSTLGIRLAGSRTSRRGIVRDVSSGGYRMGENTYSGRATILFEPSENFSNTLYLDYINSNDKGGSATRLTAVNPALAINATLGPVLVSQTARLGFYEVEGNFPNTYSRGSNAGITNVTTLALSDDITLKNIINYRDIYSRERQELDGTALAVLALDQKQTARQFTEEFQVQATGFEGKLNLIVGAYYFRETGDVVTLTYAGAAAANPRRGVALNVSKSVFAQADYKLTPNLGITLGGRYTWDERRLDQQLRSAATGACTFCAIAQTASDAPTYTASINWQVDSDRMIYLVTRSGYRSGGFSSSANNAAALAPFQPEKVTDYEIGLKADWTLFGGPLRTNLAAFHSNYSQIQRTILGAVAGVPVTTIFNAASAKVDGGEIEVTYRPVRPLELIGTAAFVSPKYKSFMDGAIDRSGNTFAYIPHETYRLGARLTLLEGDDGSKLLASADYYWQSRVYQAEFNTPLNLQKAYSLVSGRLEYSGLFNERVTIALFGRNLTKTKYFASTGDSYTSSGYVYRSIGEPRTFGAEATIKF